MQRGELHLIIGCMFSGKTSELLNKYERYTLGNKKCMLIKYEKDIRYDVNCIATHNGIKVQSYKSLYLASMDKYIHDYSVIFIDEIQFFKDAVLFIEKWSIIDNKIIYACGLNGTFDRKPFKNISKLIPLANTIVLKTAICKENGNEAIHSNRLDKSNKELEVLGEADLYEAADREKFFKDQKSLEDFTEKLTKKIDNFRQTYGV